MATRMQVIEVAQMGDAKGREEMNRTIEGLRTNNKLLLLNREQQILMEKIITTVFDKDDLNWKKVLDMSRQIDLNWTFLQEKEKAIDKFMSVESRGSKLAKKFVTSTFEGDSMEGTSLDSSERDHSVVMKIKHASSVNNYRNCVRRT